ncbi:tyrocidine synthase 3 [Kordia sp. SMS9]|uniref:non-ribosomal peptide synthetase n=1 Tax=Kordia sp. SMS9 TaxID=2282170 RepID=UPI000E0D444C|nr:non-ribosomal peptide synthetase [Kordia sp. SMS9]AXG70691.1 tyrocidine synthase 3 [Kordia sp. SMS9]
MKELIEKLKALHITLAVQDNNLVIGNVEGDFPPDLLLELKNNKQALIDYLNRSVTKETTQTGIQKIAEAENYPISPAQYRLWILSQFEEVSIAYNMPADIPLDGDYDLECFKKALNAVIERHEILRTVFKQDDSGTVQQKVLSTAALDFTITHKDFSTAVNKQQLANDYISSDTYKAFNLEKGPLLRASLIKMSETHTIFYYNIHHIISDGWSMNVLAKDVFAYYKAFKNGEQPVLTPLHIQYKDYAAWEIERVQTKQYQQDKTFWHQEFAKKTGNINLPTRKKRPLLKTNNGHAISTFVTLEEVKQLTAFQQKKGGSLFMYLMAAFKTLCYKYTGETDITIGTPVLGREEDSLMDQIGCYVNTLALRSSLKKESSFATFYQQLKEKLVLAYEHQSYPFDALIKDLKLTKDISRNPLFDIIIVFNEDKNDLKGITPYPNHIGDTVYNNGKRPVKFDIDITLNNTIAGLEIELVFNTDVYEYSAMEAFLKHYKKLLLELVHNADTAVEKLEIVTAVEKTKIVASPTETSGFANDTNIVKMFETAAKNNPNNIAVSYGTHSLTYQELDNASNQFANYLQQEHAIKNGDLVAVSLDRTEWLLVTILGILKTGSAYVPVDPEYPQSRIAYIEEDSACKITINEETLQDFQNNQNTYTTAAINTKIVPSQVAYVIYTSGSTGKPKGVAVAHKNVLSLLFPDKNLFDFNNQDVWMLFHSYSFDFSVWEIFGALLYGGKLVVLKASEAKDPFRCWEIITNQKVSILNQTPSSFYSLSEVFNVTSKSHQLRYVIFGGEALHPEKLKKWYQKNKKTQLINMYGITETTVHVTYKKIEANDIESEESRLGWFLPTLHGYVLDENKNLLPNGIPGELYVAGHGVSLGYLNNETLTRERFIENPHKKGETIYKTGDRVKFSLDNDEIIYLGRVDEQVKIRGFRIELGEIESVLSRHDAIKNVVVIAKEINNEKQLVTYVVCHKNITTSELRKFIAKFLPSHMIPSHYYSLDEIPVTSNGKLDKNALDENQLKALETGIEKIAPRNAQETKLVQIWEEILDKNNIGIADNFFLQGGDSIKLIRLLSTINKEFKSNLKASDLYANSTIELLVECLQKHENEQEESDNLEAVQQEIKTIKETILSKNAVSESVEDIYPMSDIQKGMIYASIVNKDLGVYHDQFLYPFTTENFDKNIFEKALRLITNKHSIFRTTFNLESHEEDVQIVLKKHPLSIQYVQLKENTTEENQAYITSYLEQQRAIHFELQAPLWRMTMFQINAVDNILFFEFHHAILDGWSVASFIQELTMTYDKLLQNEHYVPKKLAVTYKAMVMDEWCQKRSKNNQIFWQSELNGYEKLDLFKKQDTYKTDSRYLDANFTKQIQQFAVTQQVPLKAVMLGAFTYLLRFLIYENDVTIGLVGNNRPIVEDGDKILGCFLNTLPFRYVFDNEHETVTDFIKEIQAKSIARRNAEKVTLVDLAKRMGESSKNENPFFDVTFNYTDFHIIHEAVVQNDSQTIANYSKALESYERTNTFLDLTIDAKSSNSMSLLLCVSRELKADLQVTQLMDYYETILRFMVTHPTSKLTAIELLNTKAQNQLLHDFNNTKKQYNVQGTVVNIFDKQVRKTPNATAVVFENQSFTYQELDKLSNQFAKYLQQEYTVNAKDLIAIQLENSAWIPVCILGILKSAAAYLPIDPNYPKERIEYIKHDSNCVLNITASVLEKFIKRKENISDSYKQTAISESQLAYVIYTSGSTGKPKGVMIEHKSLKNYVCWAAETYINNESEQQDFGLFTSIAFDLSITSIFLPLTTGNRLVIFSSEKDTSEVLQNFLAADIPNMKITPAFIDLFIEIYVEASIKKTAIVGGDILQESHIAALQKLNPQINIFNEYGPTETTVGSSCYQITPNSSKILVGKPIANTTIYILNKNRQLVPKGVIGELYIGGKGVSRGYYKRETLTKERFIQNPFVAGETLFKTGDLGQWTADGNINLIGRIDNQVKVKGYRIELGEIEQCLLAKEGIKEAVVLTKTSNDTTSLIAFYVAEEKQDLAELRTFLQAQLPVYMIPNLFFALEKLPLTTNGKIAKEQLLQLEDGVMTSEIEYVAPSNEIEQELANIWGSVLHVEVAKISVHDNFFHLGGDSLKATKVILLINAQYNININLKDLFHDPSIKNIAEIIETLQLLKTAQNESSYQDDELIF